MTDKLKGVAFEKPPDKLIPDISASMARALAAVPDGKQGALVAVATEAGINAAIVTRFGNDWQVQGWIGKKWGGKVEGGASVVKTW